MCGIAGIVSSEGAPPRRDEIAAMCAAMVHRGPDDEGLWAQAPVALGMRRLAIIDVAGGQQPIANEDGSVHVVLNGELYNYRELRAELLARGHRFTSDSDTEVLVHLYEDEGVRAVERLRGMFAFAVWDAGQRRLLLGRDRLGQKPLYWARTRQRLVFASELKALFALADVERTIDPAALDHLLAFGTTPGDQSIVAGVRKLEPGQQLVFSPGGAPRVAPYWQPRFCPDEQPSAEEWVDHLRAQLDDSVRSHMVADVPVGAFLSGGVDSSAVVALMARHSARPVKTFSIGFREPAFDESRHARLVAERLGTEHHELILSPHDLPSFEELVWHLDEPFGDSSAIPTYVVSRLAAAHVKVALSGDGGDELFGGYDKYQVEAREARLDWLPWPARRLVGKVGDALPPGARGKNFLRHRALAGARRYLDAQTLFRVEDRRALLHADVRARLDLDAPLRDAVNRLGEGAGLARLQRHDLETYLPLDILTKVDRMSMAASLETRVPLLDPVLVDLVLTIPSRLHVRGGRRKDLFKRALAGLIPDEILDRKKQGFAVPLGRWLAGGLKHAARDVLLSEASRTRGLFDPAALERFLDDDHPPARPRDLDLETWTLLGVELWCRTFLDGNAAQREVA